VDSGTVVVNDSPLTPIQQAALGAGVLLITLLFMVAVGKQGQRKGQSFWFGFWFALLVNPVLTSIYIAFLRQPEVAMREKREYHENSGFWRTILAFMYFLPCFYWTGITLIILAIAAVLLGPAIVKMWR
jgi:hypothetical protein